MHNDHAAGENPIIEVAQAGKNRLVEVGIEMDKGELLFLPVNRDGCRKEALVDDDILWANRGDPSHQMSDAGAGEIVWVCFESCQFRLCNQVNFRES
jgi:hypothetical protein